MPASRMLFRFGRKGRERNAGKEAFNNAVEVFPKMVREAGSAPKARAFPAALGGIHVFIHRENDAVDGD